MNSDWSEYELLDFPGACYWDGEDPFCEGNCPEGYDECGRDDCGDGEHDDNYDDNYDGSDHDHDEIYDSNDDNKRWPFGLLWPFR